MIQITNFIRDRRTDKRLHINVAIIPHFSKTNKCGIKVQTNRQSRIMKYINFPYLLYLVSIEVFLIFQHHTNSLCLCVYILVYIYSKIKHWYYYFPETHSLQMTNTTDATFINGKGFLFVNYVQLLFYNKTASFLHNIFSFSTNSFPSLFRNFF